MPTHTTAMLIVGQDSSVPLSASRVGVIKVSTSVNVLGVRVASLFRHRLLSMQTTQTPGRDLICGCCMLVPGCKRTSWRQLWSIEVEICFIEHANLH